MDYNKIGNFIMTERKAKKLTQAKLAEKLFVSEKTVSKWENGNGVPDTATLTKLCEIFEISINELLNGERISAENYSKKAESKLLELQKSKEERDRLLLKLEIGIAIVAIMTLLILTSFASYMAEMFGEVVFSTILIILGIVLFVISILFCLKIEQIAGYYVCKKCGHKHIPTFGQVNRAMHICRTRYMKCPHCHKYSWQKKVIK